MLSFHLPDLPFNEPVIVFTILITLILLAPIVFKKFRIPGIIGLIISGIIIGPHGMNLVEFGFRLPAAIDNRPLKFEEFETLVNQIVYVSATPADYELEKSEGVYVDQVIRPTGLLDPPIEVRPSLNQIDDLMGEIRTRTKSGERTLVTTITKRMAEELAAYLLKYDIFVKHPIRV